MLDVVTSAPAKSGVFRAVNEQIRELSRRFGVNDGSHQLLCECPRDDCLARIEVPASVYERVRLDGRGSVVAPAHQAERVVERASGYWIVAGATV